MAWFRNRSPSYELLPVLSAQKSRLPCLGRTIIMVVLAFAALFSVMILAHHPRFVGFIPTTGHLSLSRNSRRAFVSLQLDTTLEEQAKRASKLPRYQPPASFPAYVISMKGAKERREAISSRFAAQNVEFEYKDAVDGLQPLPEDMVSWYTSGSRYKEYKRSVPGQKSYRKIAADLSHFQLMHKMLAQGDALQMVFEDDAVLCDGFAKKLNQTLHNLPDDWEFLWLNQKNLGQDLAGWVGPGVRIFTDNSISQGLVYTRSFALKALNDAQLGNRPIDTLINDMIQLKRAVGYVADPPLVVNAGFVSQIENF